MRLLFDANLSPELVERLSDVCAGSQHVLSVGIELSDTDIWEYAKLNSLAIVSKDSDFQQRAIVHGSPPKVIWIRLGNCTTSHIESLLRMRIEHVKEFLSSEPDSFLALP